MRLSFLAVLPLAGLLLAGAAPTGDPAPAAAGADRPERQCFFAAQVDNFRQTRGQTLYLKVRNDDVYELEAAGQCRDLDFTTTRLAILPQLGASRLCTGDPATIVVPGSTETANACRVRVVKRLDAEEIAALPDRDRP